MPPWLIYALGGFIADYFQKIKRKKQRLQLEKDLREVDYMDIIEIEKAAIRKGLIGKYSDDE